MQKYGFVYIWYDRKHKRYYIGCRWGREDDGYICSSPWMKKAYKYRPEDFKRRILTCVYTDKKDLLEAEYKWLSMIKKDELRKKYYNLHNHHFNHWSTDENKRKTIKEKINETWTPEKRAAQAEKSSKALKEKWQDPEFRRNVEAAIPDRTVKIKEYWTEERRQERSEQMKYIPNSGHFEKGNKPWNSDIRGMPAWNKGLKATEEHKQKLSKIHKERGSKPPNNRGKKWYNNGSINKMYYDNDIPAGWYKGMLKE